MRFGNQGVKASLLRVNYRKTHNYTDLTASQMFPYEV